MCVCVWCVCICVCGVCICVCTCVCMRHECCCSRATHFYLETAPLTHVEGLRRLVYIIVTPLPPPPIPALGGFWRWNSGLLSKLVVKSYGSCYLDDVLTQGDNYVTWTSSPSVTSQDGDKATWLLYAHDEFPSTMKSALPH